MVDRRAGVDLGRVGPRFADEEGFATAIAAADVVRARIGASSPVRRRGVGGDDIGVFPPVCGRRLGRPSWPLAPLLRWPTFARQSSQH
jgi:hypothetical protein